MEIDIINEQNTNTQNTTIETFGTPNITIKVKHHNRKSSTFLHKKNITTVIHIEI